METIDFLRRLYARAPSDCYVELRPLPAQEYQRDRGWYALADLAALVHDAQRVDAAGADVYYGVNPRRAPGLGGADGVACTVALIADLDVGEGKPYAHHSDAAIALDRLRREGLDASLVVSSGHGLHAYWLLAEPQREHAGARTAMAFLRSRLGAKIDDISDAPRILRVPGTRNHKRDRVEPVEVIHESDKHYRLEDFAERKGERLVSVIDDFKARASWAEILEPLGWHCARRGETELWTRPDKDTREGHSATINHAGLDLLHCFSSAAPPLAPNRSYNKFQIYSLYHHGGDDRAAVRALAEQCYGAARQSAPAEPSAKSAKSAEWPEPDLHFASADIADIDPSLLPQAIAPWVQSIADGICCHLAAPAVACMVAVGAAIGKRATLTIHGYEHVPNLWGAICAPPGMAKSAVIAAAVAPLTAIDSDAVRAYARDDQAHKAKAELADAKIRAVKSRAGKRTHGDEDAAMLAELEELGGANQRPACTRYVVHDATVEKLQEIMAGNPYGILSVQDELDGLVSTMSRESRQGERAFYLQSWGGNQQARIDRIGRGTIVIDNACLSLIGGIQPDVLDRYVQAARNGGNDGFVQRLQLLVRFDGCPKWDASRVAAARQVDVRPLFDWLLAEFRGPHELDADAMSTYAAWRDALESKIRSPGDALLLTHLAKYRSLMPSLALCIHALRRYLDDAGQAIDAGSVRLAIQWCEYLERHAVRLYSGDTHLMDDQRRLLAGLRRSGRHWHTLRDVYRADSAWRSRDPMPALAELERRNVLRLERRERNDSYSITISPHISAA